MFSENTNILVVDDSRTMRRIVVRALNEQGFNKIVEADNGVDAWEKIRSLQMTAPIGLIISDWNMPEMTGIDLLKNVRSNAQTKGLPFVLLTAEAEKEQVKEAIVAGVDSYITKPFPTALLMERLKSVYAVFQKRNSKVAA